MKGLEGIKVLELGEGVSAAYAAKLMADLGADVIKVETPEGDLARRRGPFPGNAADPEKSGLFLYLNANKRGVVLDLPAEKARLEQAARWADVIVHNWAPPAMARLGIDPDELAAINPRAVICSVTPFGLTGPHKDYRAEEITTVHGGGWAYISPGASQFPDEPPLKPFGHQGDFETGLAAAVACLGHLYRALRTGEGECIDLSTQECVLSFIEHHFIAYSYLGRVFARTEPRLLYPWGVFPCRDGAVFMVVAEPHQWQALLDLMGRPAWALRDEFKDPSTNAANWRLLRPHLVEWLSTWTMQEFFEAAQKKRICVVPVLDMAGLDHDAHLSARGFFVDVEHPEAGRIRQPGPPYQLREPWWEIRKGAPLLGADNTAVFAEWQAAEPAPPPAQPAVPRAPKRPLDGVRIADFTWVWAGPFGAMQLAHLGAEVIKIESADRLDLARRVAIYPADMEPHYNRCAYFNQWSQGKKSVALDLSKPEALEVVKELIGDCDVVMDNFAAGVMERLGLGYDDLVKIKPDIVMASICGFGHSGPCAPYIGYGPAVAMISGVCSLSGYHGGSPQEVGISYGDPNGGWNAATAICAALVARERTGRGQYIDVSLWEAMSVLVPEGWMGYAMNGGQPQRMGNRDVLMAPHNCYPAAGEDEWVTIACADDAEWRALARAIGRPELADDPRFAGQTTRKANEDALDALIAEWTRTRTKWQTTEILQAVGVAAFPTMHSKDLDEDPHIGGRGFFSQLPHPEVGVRKHPGIPWHTARGPNGVRSAAPILGADTDQVLRDVLGYPADRIARLREAQVLN